MRYYYEGVEEKIINTYGGADTIYIGGVNFTVDGGIGNDHFYTDRFEASNKFIFKVGDGDDTFSSGNSEEVRLFFQDSTTGEVISLEDLSVELTTDNHAVLNYSQSDSIEFTNYTYSIPNHTFFLSDGSFHYFDEITRIENGTSQSETISLSSTAGSTVNTGAGDDIVYDNGYSDTNYIFNIGDGNDELHEYVATGQNIITFGALIAEQDLTFDRNNNDLTIQYSSTDSVTIKNWYDPIQGAQINSISFAGGSIMNYQAILTIADSLAAPSQQIIGTEFDDYIQGGTGDDHIQALGGDDVLDDWEGNNTFEGGLGNDTVYAGTGDDTYILNQGDGHDFYVEFGGYDKVQFGAGIIESDIVFDRFGDALFIGFGENDSATISDWYFDLSGQIEEIAFDNGAVWDKATIDSFVSTLIDDSLPTSGMNLIGDENANNLFGTDFDDTLTGLGGDDFLDGGYSGYNILDGGQGNDILWGGIEDDTYLFSAGDGFDNIDDLDGIDDAIIFDETISYSDILIDSNGTDLFIDNVSTGDSIQVSNGYAVESSKMESIIFSDGTIWTKSIIDQMADEAIYANNPV